MSIPAAENPAAKSIAPETVTVPSGSLQLTGLLWRPAGAGPFPAVLFNHGSGPTVASKAQRVGPIFARHGYVLLYLFRRGDGLSKGQGTFMGDQLDREGAAKGEAARNRLQLQLLTTDQLSDVRAGIAYLKAMPQVDASRVAVAGHSFGGQLAILAAEGDPSLQAAVCFAPAALAWSRSSELRERLLAAVRQADVPILLLFAANDFSTAPGEALAAERRRVEKPGELKVYPAVGRSAEEGHDAVYRAADVWEADVFEFLDRYVKR